MKRIRGRVAGASLAAALALGAPSVARAQSYGVAPVAAPDAVTLKDGSVIRGSITELSPGSHVVVQLAGGQVARVRWDVVAKVERQGVPVSADASPSPAPAAPTPAAPAPLAGPTVFVHIDSPDPVNLELAVSSHGGRVLCESPCDMAVPLEASYRITGKVRASRAFTIAARPGDHVVLTIDPASKGGFAGGVVMVSVGGVSLLLGGLTWLVSELVYETTSHRSGSGGKTVGLVMLGLGVGAIAGGITMMVVNGSTGVDQASAPTAAPLPPAAAWLRAPEESRESAEAAALPPAFVAPVTFRF